MVSGTCKCSWNLLIALACSPRFRDTLILWLYTEIRCRNRKNSSQQSRSDCTPQIRLMLLFAVLIPASSAGKKISRHGFSGSDCRTAGRPSSYLHEAASHFPGMLYLGGHSKGGNLAVDSAVKSDPSIRRRILDDLFP